MEFLVSINFGGGLLNKEELPYDLREKISDMLFVRINTGESGAKVYRVSSEAASYYLKIETAAGRLEEEYQKTRWLQKKLEVPGILYYGEDNKNKYMLLTEIKGKILCDKEYIMNPEATVKLLAKGLGKLAEVDTDRCPFDNRLEKKLEKAAENVRLNRVDMINWEETTKFSNPESLLNYLYRNKPSENEVIFTHGDYCLSNIMGEQDEITGFIDLGRTGIADIWQDIALCMRSMYRNFGTRKYEKLLLEYLGRQEDKEKLEYYILLDEMF